MTRASPLLARVLVALLALLAAPAMAAEPSLPALTGRVVDEAGVLAPATRARLTEMLAAHEQATREQIVVVTLKSLQGYTIEDFGVRLGRAWGIGEKGRDTGALLIVAPSDRKVRVEVGYGLEGRLTDAASRGIIEQTILPAFRRGNIDGGVLDGTAAILRALGGAPGGGSSAGGSAEDHEPFASALVWLLVVCFLILRALVTFGGPGRGRRGFGYPGVWYAGGSSGGFGGGGGGGGFSGGGGSFGGGGASGGW